MRSHEQEPKLQRWGEKMGQVLGGLVGMIWLYPIMWYVFGKENVWWVMSLIITGAAIMVLCGKQNAFDGIEHQTKMKGNDVFYLYDYTDRSDD